MPVCMTQILLDCRGTMIAGAAVHGWRARAIFQPTSASTIMNDLLLRVEQLQTEFATPFGVVKAVRGVSLEMKRGETVGLVGESGSGKSVLALSLMRLIPSPPGRIRSGEAKFGGTDLLTLPEREMRRIRGGQISMIFQDPFSCLNPTMTAGSQVVEAIQAHTPLRGKAAWDRALELFRAVRLPSPELRLRQYPHQMSGGQRQRVMIAMAFATEAALLIADEPTTALDVTVQAQILALMQDMKERTGTAILLITHDLGVVAETCDRVLVMYAGEIVEEGPVADLFREPLHPYTQGLLKSLPNLEAPPSKRLPTIPGQPPDLLSLEPGCAFAARCPHVMEQCRAEKPKRTQSAENRAVRCHLLATEDAV